MLKRILLLCMVISLVFGITVFAAETDNKAVIELNKIGIVKGDGKDFNLNGYLKRSEAAVIVTRLLGVEKMVLSGAEYRTGSAIYSDISLGQWYTPYIKYLSSIGVLNGYPDGTIKPNNDISEKEMLKMILTALGYTYDKDFNMNNIYTKALEWNVLIDESYANKTTDDKDFTREECFNLIRRSLDANYKGKNETIISRWIDAGIYTAEELQKANIITDLLKTAISDIEVVDQNTIKVFLNEPVQQVLKDDIKITYGSNSSLSVNSVTTAESILTISTAAQAQLQEYSIVINSIKDTAHNIVKNISASFKGYKPEEITSEKFLISKIEPVSKDTIKVYFTQDISAVPTIPNFYDIYEGEKLWVDGNAGNMYIAKLTDSNRGIIIRLTGNVFNVFNTYSLKVSGTMTDYTGLRINNGNDDSMAFVPLVVDNLALKRDITYAFSKNVVTVEFNKAVDPVSAETIGSYQILDANNNPKIGIPKINPDNPKQVLIGMLEPLTAGVKYKLNILNPVKDLETATSVTETGIEFSVADASVDELKVVLVEAVSNSELRVYFNRRLNPSTIDLSKFFLTSGNDPVFSGVNLFNSYCYDSYANPLCVSLFLDPAVKKMKSSATYTLKVTDALKDYLSQSNGELTYEFSGNGNDKVSPEISSGLILSDKIVKLEFDKLISANNNVATNYRVKYKKSDDTDAYITASSASVFANKYVILQFSEALDIGKIYKLEYLAIMDYRGDSFAGGSANEFHLGYAY